MSELDAFRKIGEVIVGAGGQPNIQFSSIDQKYRHLQLDMQLRADTVGLFYSELYGQFNGDTTANYDSEYIQGSGATAAAANFAGITHMFVGHACGSTAQANNAASLHWIIHNYSATVFNKSCLSQVNLCGTTPSTQTFVEIMAQLWHSTAAVTSILLFPQGGNFIAGSVCSLYGML